MKKTAQNPDLPILLVDDDEDVGRAVARTLGLNGFNNLLTLTDSREVLPLLNRQEVALILLDLTMPHLRGDKVLEEIISSFPRLPVIMATATDDIDTVVDCMKKGAFDYVTKPFSTSRLLTATRCALEMRELRRENEALRLQELGQPPKRPELFAGIITGDRQMLKIFNYIEMIGPSSQPVLISGETGVGKELAARAVHGTSNRKGAFVAVNVAGLDDEVFSDTLFGHTKGAFTGATSSRAGQIKKAAAGTLFLDEIGDLSLKSQVKLLRLLQEKEYLPLGGDTPQMTDARIIAATNHNLAEMVDRGTFRKDLYFRLYAHLVHLPPLRDRLTDMPLLVENFADQATKEFGGKKLSLRPEIYPLLENYAFPGNIRELKAMVFDAVSRQPGRILGVKVFMEIMNDSGNSEIPDESITETKVTFGPRLPSVKEVRLRLAAEALNRTNGNISLAARLIGLSRQSLSQFINRHDITFPGATEKAEG